MPPGRLQVLTLDLKRSSGRPPVNRYFIGAHGASQNVLCLLVSGYGLQETQRRQHSLDKFGLFLSGIDCGLQLILSSILPSLDYALPDHYAKAAGSFAPRLLTIGDGSFWRDLTLHLPAADPGQCMCECSSECLYVLFRKQDAIN